jgi:AcrR family transcriptional regulator
VSARTVNWSSPPEGLRERKKRLMRQQLSDTATAMFLERGFDAVRVTEVAAACGVSEKTVYNYFPTKESLVLDRWDSTMTALRAGLAHPGVAPVEAVLGILGDELRALLGWLRAQEDRAVAVDQLRRFGELIGSTPALRAHQHDAADRLRVTAAEVLASRTGRGDGDPEVAVASAALTALWQVQADSITRQLGAAGSPAQIERRVTADVERAARLLDTGLGALTAGS